MKPNVSFSVAMKPWRRGADDADVEPPVELASEVEDEREYVAPPVGETGIGGGGGECYKD